jgi:hypothetical protein
MQSSESLPAIEMMSRREHQQQIPQVPPAPSSARSVGGTPSESGTPIVEDRSSFVEPPSIEIEDVGEPSMGEAVDGYEPRERRRRKRLTREKWDASSKKP